MRVRKRERESKEERERVRKRSLIHDEVEILPGVEEHCGSCQSFVL